MLNKSPSGSDQLDTRASRAACSILRCCSCFYLCNHGSSNTNNAQPPLYCRSSCIQAGEGYTKGYRREETEQKQQNDLFEV